MNSTAQWNYEKTFPSILGPNTLDEQERIYQHRISDINSDNYPLGYQIPPNCKMSKAMPTVDNSPGKSAKISIGGS